MNFLSRLSKVAALQTYVTENITALHSWGGGNKERSLLDDRLVYIRGASNCRGLGTVANLVMDKTSFSNARIKISIWPGCQSWC